LVRVKMAFGSPSPERFRAVLRRGRIAPRPSCDSSTRRGRTTKGYWKPDCPSPGDVDAPGPPRFALARRWPSNV
jgi:hypothetical protein